MALIVGLATATAEPYATRGWGLAPVPGEPASARLLLDGDDPVLAALLGQRVAIAVTGSDVRTLVGAQLKGRVDRVEEVTEDDLLCHDRYREAYFGAIVEVDGFPRHLLDRALPASFTACVVTVDEAYDQTPGPGAGAPLRRSP